MHIAHTISYWPLSIRWTFPKPEPVRLINFWRPVGLKSSAQFFKLPHCILPTIPLILLIPMANKKPPTSAQTKTPFFPNKCTRVFVYK